MEKHECTYPDCQTYAGSVKAWCKHTCPYEKEMKESKVEPMDARYEPRIGPLELWSAPIMALIIVAFGYWLTH